MHLSTGCRVALGWNLLILNPYGRILLPVTGTCRDETGVLRLGYSRQPLPPPSGILPTLWRGMQGQPPSPSFSLSPLWLPGSNVEGMEFFTAVLGTGSCILTHRGR